MRKNSAIFGVFLSVVFVGYSIFFLFNREIPVSSQTFQDEIFKTYANEKNGYELQYPSFFSLNDSNPDDVQFTYDGCDSGVEPCLLGLRSVEIAVSENQDGMSMDEYYENWQKTCPSIERIKIFPVPENFDESQLIEALRCPFDAIPKEAPGGYQYLLFRNNQFFTITMLQGDSTFLAYADGSLFNLTQDNYDPLGDVMMRTFKFKE